MAYDYYHGPRIALAKLLAILAELPADSTIWPMPTGSLSVMDGGGVYLGYIDTAYDEAMKWARPLVAEKDGGDGFFG